MRLSVGRQLKIFHHPPRPILLDRPCTVGDGILRLSRVQIDRCLDAAEEARRAGRFTQFIPASGASSRMFKEVRQAGGNGLFLKNLKRFPFYHPLKRALAQDGWKIESLVRQGRDDLISDYLLTSAGLNYDTLPKGLIPFHRTPRRLRTALEEHLRTSAALVRDRRGFCRVHMTVSPSHLKMFKTFIASKAPALERDKHCRFRIELSVQKRSTDTIAVDLNNRPFRREDGRPLFRPGGHGALLENLNALKGDIVFISNIDNVPTDRGRDRVIYWRKVLAGLLVSLQKECRFGGPLRICGVVKNEGEPGGGPFWVKEKTGSSRQLVESAQVSSSPAQQAILKSSTHFNPVDIVCGLRDRNGRPFNLRKYSDPSAVFISRRFYKAQKIKALELPGLWNGGMARWNTVFVEIPVSTFNPVKTITDLLKPSHQPR